MARLCLLISVVLSMLISSMSYNPLRQWNLINKRTILFSDPSDVSSDTVVAICQQKIMTALNPLRCLVKGSNDDPNGSHIAIEVVSEAFEGKSTMQRQQLVYKAIWAEMSGPVHAVDSIIAKTPSECGL